MAEAEEGKTPEQTAEAESRSESGAAEAAGADVQAAAQEAEGPETEAPADEAEAPKPAAGRKGKGRGARSVPAGVVHIRSTFNNTIVSITDPQGGVVAWSSSGRAGFKGSRKSTSFAATIVGQDAARQAVGRGMREVEVHVQGAGSGRESAVRALQSAGLTVTVIKDVTPIPHNGCRARKRRRV
ncbi:MAG: 30S ribosomal protein S11 [Lentisphaerae bacterium]|nr:30S ribosomal protein S11 [Lentisphaerota bacterium]